MRLFGQFQKSNSRKFTVAISARKAPVRGNRTRPGRGLSVYSGVVETNVARIGYKQLRLATLTTSENF
jgi:hypothetical protein